jgi:hypothetical protein
VIEYPRKEVDEEIEPKRGWKVLGKYFMHGFAFSLLFLYLTFTWPFIVILPFMFVFIAIIIVVILLFVVTGLNICLTEVIWNVKINKAFWSLLLHGFNLLLFLSIMTGIFVLLPNFVFPGTATTVITFVIGAFVDGYVGKSVAMWFQK